MLSSKIVQFGDTLTITAQGFSSGETVQLQLMDSSTGTWNLGTLSCNNIGTCTGSQVIQSGCGGGNYQSIALGETSQLKAAAPSGNITIN